MSLVSVRNLRVIVPTSGLQIVDQVNFSLEAGELVGLVGESGAGKTTIGTALLGHASRGSRVAEGEIVIDGVHILELTPSQLRAVRGPLVAYVPQDPSASLNPALRLRTQLLEMIKVHRSEWSRQQRDERLASVLHEVRLPDSREFLRRYPHQISGGQQQRLVLAMAFVLRPKLIVLDEPTTGLDVTTQAHVLDTIRELCKTHGIAGVYVTHDLAVVANLADRVLVAYAGRLVELGSWQDIAAAPAHPYTRLLLATIPVVEQRRRLTPIPGQAPSISERSRGCFFVDRCPEADAHCRESEPELVAIAPGHSSRCFHAERVAALPPLLDVTSTAPEARGGESILTVRNLEAFYGPTQALFPVSLEIRRGECLALVGESGSGKTTLARCLVGLSATWRGEVAYCGQPLAHAARARPSSVRREIQYIFQSPYTSLNPRRTLEESIGTPLRNFFGLKGRAAHARVVEALEDVHLPARYCSRYPDQLSGGQRQRVAIARALVCDPSVLICDEVTSGLDVSVQAAIVRLIETLQTERNLAVLFVTHNLALVRSIGDRLVVLRHGRIVESGDCDQVLTAPAEPYTRSLIADTPSLAGAAERVG